MSTLGKRLDALERIAERCRRQEMRELILALEEARDLTPAEVDEAVDEAIRHLAEIRQRR